MCVVRKRDVRNGGPGIAWDDPEGIAYNSPERRQAMLDNPLSRSDEDPVQLLAVLDNRVIGRIDIYWGEIVAQGKTYPIAWGSSLNVSPSFRQGGAGLLLILKLQSLARIAGVCGVAEMACELYRRLRWVEHAMPRYVFLRRSRSVVEHFTGRGLVSRILTPVVNAGLDAYGGLLALRYGRSDLESAAIDASAVHQNSIGSAVVEARRDAGVLRWMLEASFDNSNPAEKFLAAVRARGRTLGHYLAKLRHYDVASHRGFRDLRLGSLQDWAIYHPQDLTFRDLVLRASRHLFEHGADAVEFCAPSPAEAHTLKSLGFVRAGQLHLFLHIRDRAPELHDRARWRLRPCEGDNFFS